MVEFIHTRVQGGKTHKSLISSNTYSVFHSRFLENEKLLSHILLCETTNQPSSKKLKENSLHVIDFAYLEKRKTCGKFRCVKIVGIEIAM